MAPRLLAGALLAMLLITTTRAQTPAEPADEALKRSVALYEMALRGAVAVGGQKLAEKARSVVPEITLRTDPPIVRGFPLPRYGFHFDVQAPDIHSTVLVLDMVNTANMANRPTRPVSQVGRTAATGGLVEDDPMPGFNASREYSAYVREALIDALLDASGVLRLQDGEHLAITASGIDQPDANPLYRERKLVLTISGADLNAYRQGRLTRDQTKERIVEDRF